MLIQKGAKGPHVTKIQKALKYKGHGRNEKETRNSK